MATDNQVRYIEQLLIDCQLGDNRQRRNAYVSAEVNREIRFLDELSFAEAGKLIDTLKELKSEKSEGRMATESWKRGDY